MDIVQRDGKLLPSMDILVDDLFILGWYAEALFPTLFKMTEFMIKSNNDEKLDEKSIEELVEINKKLDILLKGGNVGKRFSTNSPEK